MGEGNAEFGFRRAGGDLGVGLGIDIGIDAQGDGRALVHRKRHRVQRFQFRLAFDIELVDAFGRAPARISAVVLPTPEKTILLGGDARRPRFFQFAARDHIGARAQLAPGSSARPDCHWP